MFWYPEILYQFLCETQVCEEGHIFESVTKIAKDPPLHFSFFFVMYRPLQIQYSQIAKAALRFIIPWSSLNKGPKFIPSIRALLSLNWDAGHLFWESCETLTCKPLVWIIPCPGHQTAHGPHRVSSETLFIPNIFNCTSLYISCWHNLGDWLQWKMQLDFRMEIVHQPGKLRGFMYQLRGRNLWMTSHNSCNNKHRAETVAFR